MLISELFLIYDLVAAIAKPKRQQTKISRPGMCKTLYMPVASFSFGCWDNGSYAPFVARLLVSDKSKNTIIVALMRKPVTIAQSVLKHQKPFTPVLLNPQS